MLRNRSTQAPPAVADVRRYLLDDRFSVARLWRDATYDSASSAADGEARRVKGSVSARLG